MENNCYKKYLLTKYIKISLLFTFFYLAGYFLYVYEIFSLNLMSESLGLKVNSNFYDILADNAIEGSIFYFLGLIVFSLMSYSFYRAQTKMMGESLNDLNKALNNLSNINNVDELDFLQEIPPLKSSCPNSDLISKYNNALKNMKAISKETKQGTQTPKAPENTLQ